MKCGDSKKKKKSAHCYAFPADDGMRVYCHRCGYSSWFSVFLRSIDEDLYGEYLLEEFGGERSTLDEEVSRAAEVASLASPAFKPKLHIDLPSVADLPPEHFARTTCSTRMIPRDRWSSIYHADDFFRWASSFTDKYDKYTFTDTRLVLPISSPGGRLIGFQGRAYSNDARAKYLTVRLEEESPFLFGLERVDTDSKIVAVEGPIDSMFLPNAVASAGGVITRELSRTGLDKSRFTVAYDNEPRKRETIDKMRRAVTAGYPVFVWPESVRSKDFNDWHVDLVESGVSVEDASVAMASAVERRTFADLRAELEIQSWSKT